MLKKPQKEPPSLICCCLITLECFPHSPESWALGCPVCLLRMTIAPWTITIGGHILGWPIWTKCSRDASWLRICCHILAGREESYGKCFTNFLKILIQESIGKTLSKSMSIKMSRYLDLCCSSKSDFSNFIKFPDLHGNEGEILDPDLAKEQIQQSLGWIDESLFHAPMMKWE